MPTSQLGFPDVPRSITNPNVKIINAIDSNDPMSFLTFIKTTSDSFKPDTLQNYYNQYLSNWNKQKIGVSEDNNLTIVDRYREFIKEISIDYTTNEERKFLSKLDFNDPSDLEIAIPFFSQKLIQISEYFKNKREDTKFETTRKKIIGTNFGMKKEILELTLDYLDSVQDKDLIFDYEKIKNKIEVDVEELYDYNPLYFNQDPSPLIYDNKDLDYGLDIFLKDDKDLISDVFSEFSDDIKRFREVDSLFENKRDLTRKYISTDFYFLSTGDSVTNFLSGKAFDAVDPISNFLNRYYPTTASTDRENLQTPSQVGFFKPQKTSIILVDGERSTYSFNFKNLKPNSIYYFPDPSIFGVNGDIITFIVDDSQLKLNNSSGIAKNLPTSKSDSDKTYGYVSSIEIGEDKYLDGIFESGYVEDSKHDIYGNLYGLFKDNNNFRSNISTTSGRVIKSLVLNGHLFSDNIFDEGANFDYSIEDYSTLTHTKRSGLSANTGGFTNHSDYYTLFGRFFTPYQELKYAQENDNIGYNDTVLNVTEYNTLSSESDNIYKRMDLSGSLYIKNLSTNKIDTILNHLTYLENSISDNNIKTELSNKIESFDIINDVIFIETENYLTIFKLKFDGSDFINPHTNIYTFNKNETPFNHITNRFKISNNVFFSLTNKDNNPLTTQIFNLTIFKLDLSNFKLVQFDHTIDFQYQSSNMIKMDSPILSYNPRPNIMAISFLVKGSNNVFELTELDFDFRDFSLLRYNRFTT